MYLSTSIITYQIYFQKDSTILRRNLVFWFASLCIKTSETLLGPLHNLDISFKKYETIYYLPIIFHPKVF